MHRAIPLGLRALQFFISLTILSLAAALINQQVYGDSPVTTRYSTFTGGFGMLVCGVGAAALFVSFIPALVPIVLDALMGLFFLAGGIAWAYGLRHTQSCTDRRAMVENDLLNRGSIRVGDDTVYGVYEPDFDWPAIYDRLRWGCQRGVADQVLQFIACGTAAGLIAVGFVTWRKGAAGGGRHPAL